MKQKAARGYGTSTAKLFAGVVLLLAAVVGLGYGSMLREMDRAAGEYAQGDMEAALKRYETVEQRLRAFGAVRFIPVGDRQNLILNQARLLYALKRYDEAMDRLERENEIAGLTSDGRFFLLRGNIAFRKAVAGYVGSEKKDPRVLEEALLGAEDNLRDSLRLSPSDWDAKFNIEFINFVRNLMSQADKGKIKVLMENVRPKVMKPKPLPPEQQG